MCGRFYVDEETLAGIKQTVSYVDQKMRSVRYGKDVYPTNYAPTMILKDQQPILSAMQWGLPRRGSSGVIFNARAEKVEQKIMFAHGIKSQRVVVPAKWFYEWNTEKEKNIFERMDQQPLLLAGFYEKSETEDRFVILTTSANESVQSVHSRMPLILEENQVEQWLCHDLTWKKILMQIPCMLKRRCEYEQIKMF